MKTTLSLALTVAAGLVAEGCGGGKQSSSGSAGVPPGVYYNLVPGLCAEYSNDAGGTGPTVGVHIQTATNPPGIELRRVKHGQQEENDFLSFNPDGGGVLLAERELFGTTMTQEVYTTPLQFLPAPPLGAQTLSLDSTSVCGNGSACATMSLDVSIASSSPYTGVYSVADGGQVQTNLDFSYQYNGDGGLTLDEWGMVPGIGFTDLYLVDDTNNLSHYLLVDIIPDDGGVCANH